jgi:hypothetical protein
MHIFYNKIKLFTFFYFFLISLIKSDQEFCQNQNDDCIACVLCLNEDISCDCIWTINGCTSVSGRISEDNSWNSKITICQNSNRATYTNYIYCPTTSSRKTEDDLDGSKSIIYTIQPDSLGHYGRKMIVCNFEYEQYTQNDIEISVEYSSLIQSALPKVYIESTDISNSKRKENISSNTKLEFSKIEKIVIKVLLKDEYITSPLKIKLTVDSSNIARIISITLIVLFFGIVIGCLIFCAYRMYKNNEARKAARLYLYRQAHANMARIQQENGYYYQGGYQENSVDIEQINKDKLDILFKTKMAEHFYKKEYNEFGGGCSICLTDFKKKSKVSITSCKHVFHYKCIHDWLYKNIRNPKCPNCNNEVLNDEDEHKLNQGKDTKIIKIKKKTEIKDPNINVPNINMRGVININNNIEDGSNYEGSNYDASQSNRPQLDEL